MHALPGVADGHLQGGFSDAHTLGGDAQAGPVHQGEHGLEAFSRGAQEEALGVVEANRRRRRPVDAELVLEALHVKPVLAAVGQRAGAEIEGEPAGRALRLLEGGFVAGQYQVDLTTAVRDEDLLSIEEVATIPLAGACRDGAEVRAGLGLGEVHRSHHLARGEARQILLLELFARVDLDVFRDARLQADDGHQSRIGSGNHLDDDVLDGVGEFEATVLRFDTQAHETHLGEFLVAFLDVLGVDDLAVFELSDLVPTLAAGTLDFAADSGGGLQDLDQGVALGRGIDVPALAPTVEAVPIDQLVHVEEHAVVQVTAHGKFLVGSPTFREIASKRPAETPRA